MCCDDYTGLPMFPLREKMCKKFIITDEQEICRKFYVNVSQFQERKQEIALCKLLMHLSSRGLIVKDRKFYMPKFNAIIETKTFCRIKLKDLDQKEVVLISYPKSKDNQEIIKENIDFQPIVIFPPKAFKPFTPSGFDLYSMAEEKFNLTQTFNPNLIQSQCSCTLPLCTDELLNNSCCSKKEPNEEIEYSFLYLQQEIKNQFLETEIKQEHSGQERKEQIEEEEKDEMEVGEERERGEDKIEVEVEGMEEKEEGQEKQKRSEITTLENKNNHSSLQIKNQSSGNTEEIKPKEPLRRTRQPQRKIAEVIVLTKIWRELHERKGWSLIEAAKLVGISKKSLDDYFLVLRVGVIQGYDFAGSLTQGMGDLRAFIKQKQTKVSGKLRKNVECFGLVPELNLDLVIQQYSRGENLNLFV